MSSVGSREGRKLCDDADVDAKEIYESKFGQHGPGSTLSPEQLTDFVNAVNLAHPELRGLYDAHIMMVDANNGMFPRGP